MSSPGFWSRIRSGRLLQVLIVYLGASWVVLQVVNELSEALTLPDWVSPVAVILLVIGLLIILATAWVQSQPMAREREEGDEVPSSWELDLADAVRTVGRGRLPHLTWARALAGGAAAFLVLFGVAGFLIVIRDRGGSLLPAEAAAATAPHGIAVMPFTVRGEEIREWREGLVDLLSTGLDGAGGLRGIASSTVFARWGESAGHAADLPEAAALEVARRTGARYALLGSAVAIGPRVRVTGEVHALEGGRRLGEVHAEGPPDSVLALVDRLALQTIALLSDQGEESLPRVDVASVTTSSLPALKAYLQGESLFRRGAFVDAAAAYERAVHEDSLFALAYYRLSQSFGWHESSGSPRGNEALERAVKLLDRLPDRERMLTRTAEAQRNDDADAVRLGREAVRKYPDEPEAWYLLGEAQLHVRPALLGWEEAEESFQRAIALAPAFAPYQIHMVESAVRYHADSTLLAERLGDLERAAPGTPVVRRYRTVQGLAFGDSAMFDSLLASTRQLPAGGGELSQLKAGLGNPYFFERFERLMGDAIERATPQERMRMSFELAHRRFRDRGQLEATVERFRSTGAPPQAILGLMANALFRGLQIPTPEVDALVRQVEAGGEPSSPPAVALRAAMLGNKAAHAATVGRVHARAESSRAAGDTAAASEREIAARALDALWAWQQGEPELAVRDLESAVGVVPGGDAIAWLLGRIHLDLGDPREAERYFRSLLTWDPDPLARYYLGRTYHELNQPDKARPHLEFFVVNWADADPPLQPLVEDARQRLVDINIEGP